jgi:hypothetical protein
MKIIEPSKREVPGNRRKITEPQLRVNALNGRISVYPSELAEEFFPHSVLLTQGEESDGPHASGKLFFVSGKFPQGKTLSQSRKGNTKSFYFVDKKWAEEMVKYSKNAIPACNLKLEKLIHKRIVDGQECDIFFLSPTNIEQPKEIYRKKPE